jgi:hypothetical protein
MNSLGILAGGSWASGVNLYMTIAGLGIAHRMEWLILPGDMKTLANPLVIGVAILMYAVEFVADKIPFVDSAWDAVHTFIRPAGGMALGYMAMANVSPAIQYPVAVLTGSIALDSHLTKATARAAINTSPEPFSNSIASVAEDAGVFGVMYLIIKHPVIATILVILFILFSIWFLKTMFRFIKKIFSRSGGRPPETQQATSS